MYEFFDNKLVWKEQHLYGAERIGTYMVEATLYNANTSTTTVGVAIDDKHLFEDNEKTKDGKWVALAHYVGLKRYEISNHLGNVLAVVTDRRMPDPGAQPGSVPGYWQAEVVQIQEYYVFGAKVPNRCWEAGDKYRYGFNTQQTSDEIGEGHFTAMYWEYDSRLGRRWNLDPVVKDYESPYSCLGNNPIWYSDILGNDTTRNSQGHLVWKIEKGDMYGTIAKKLADYGLGEPNLTEKLMEWNPNQGERSLTIGASLNLMEYSNGLPVHTIYFESTPTIYMFTAEVLSRRPDYQVLNYEADKKVADKKRDIATFPCSASRIKDVIEIDEFPYASTIEGGLGAECMPVPSLEQRIQGGQLSQLYRKLGYSPGPFIVKLSMCKPVKQRERVKERKPVPPVPPVLVPVPRTYSPAPIRPPNVVTPGILSRVANSLFIVIPCVSCLENELRTNMGGMGTGID